MAETNEQFDKRARARELAEEFAKKGSATGWFEALYAEAAGDNEKIPWADLEPNKYFKPWAEDRGLKGEGRKALVVGCGLGDDARLLWEMGFKVTGFDISPTAIEWARKLHADTDIQFETMAAFRAGSRLARGVRICAGNIHHSAAAVGDTPPSDRRGCEIRSAGREPGGRYARQGRR